MPQDVLLQAEAVVDDEIGLLELGGLLRRDSEGVGVGVGFIRTVTSASSPTILRVMSPRMFVVTTTLGRSCPSLLCSRRHHRAAVHEQ